MQKFDNINLKAIKKIKNMALSTYDYKRLWLNIAILFIAIIPLYLLSPAIVINPTSMYLPLQATNTAVLSNEVAIFPANDIFNNYMYSPIGSVTVTVPFEGDLYDAEKTAISLAKRSVAHHGAEALELIFISHPRPWFNTKLKIMTLRGLAVHS